MVKGNFGEHLRREREMRGVSLEEIASATRIQTRFLEALESEQWEKLPGGVFNRGFVRAVAHYLGLDSEAMLGEYTLATGDRGTASSVPARFLPSGSSRTHWAAWLLVVMVVSALLAGGLYEWKRHLARKRASANPRAEMMIGRSDPSSKPKNLPALWQGV